MAMAVAQWYYTVNGERKGPVPEKQLKQLAAAGTLKPDDLVWKKDMISWQPASQVAGLFAPAAEAATGTSSYYESASTPAQMAFTAICSLAGTFRFSVRHHGGLSRISETKLRIS